MQKITTLKGLHDAIHQLEGEQAEQKKRLKAQLNQARTGPGLLGSFMNTITGLVTSPLVVGYFLNAAFGQTGKPVSGKIPPSRSGNGLFRMLKNLSVFVITEVMIRKPELIRLIGQRILWPVFGRKKPAF